MELKNYERELKYLLKKNYKVSFEEILEIFNSYDYSLIESRHKKKHEIYYDDANLSILKKGDVLRGSTHFNKDSTYFHFMYKKNVSDPCKPYVSKYEFGSGQFKSVHEFISALDLSDVIIQPDPVLYAEMTRETAVFKKDDYKFLVSYDNVEYHKDINAIKVCEKMLEVEDWTNPYTTMIENDKYDAHLLSVNSLLLNKLPLELTKNSKPYRGFLLINESSL